MLVIIGHCDNYNNSYKAQNKFVKEELIMVNNPTTNKQREKCEEYNVSDLYILTTYRKRRVDSETTRYITEYFIGVKDDEEYYEFFSNVHLNMLEGTVPPEFDKPFVSEVIPLNTVINISTIERNQIFNYILNFNAEERSALDVVD